MSQDGWSAAGASASRTLIDWIRVTHNDVEALRPLLGDHPSKYKVPEHFAHALLSQTGAVLAWTKHGFGMLDLNGGALQTWRKSQTEREIVMTLAATGAKATRIDLARDTSAPTTPTWLSKKVMTGCVVGNLNWKQPQRSGIEGSPGFSIRVGTRGGAAIGLRVYDRKAAIESSGAPCDLVQLTRWELEVKQDKVKALFERLVGMKELVDQATGETRWPLDQVHAAVLQQVIRRVTLVPPDRQNRHQGRAKPDPLWTEFVGSGEFLPLTVPQSPDYDPVKSVVDWFKSSAAPALAFIREAGGDDAVEGLIKVGREHIRPDLGELLKHEPVETRTRVRAAISLVDPVKVEAV